MGCRFTYLTAGNTRSDGTKVIGFSARDLLTTTQLLAGSSTDRAVLSNVGVVAAVGALGAAVEPAEGVALGTGPLDADAPPRPGPGVAEAAEDDVAGVDGAVSDAGGLPASGWTPVEQPASPRTTSAAARPARVDRRVT
jgi:hypothetical protein